MIASFEEEPDPLVQEQNRAPEIDVESCSVDESTHISSNKLKELITLAGICFEFKVTENPDQNILD